MKTMMVNVSVAGLWTSPDSPRELDEFILANPVKLEEWLARLGYDERLALCEENLLQSQVLYGTQVKVLEERGAWAKVLVPDQPSSKDENGYPGWMALKQLQEVNETENPDTMAVMNRPRGFLYNQSQEKTLEISFQTRLPVVKEDGEWVEVQAPFGIGRLKRDDVIFEQMNGPSSVFGADIVKAAEQFLGLPYLWGGMSGFGYDCSGFAHMMHRSVGLIIPRDASDQTKWGQNVEREGLEPGDLLFFAYENGKGYVHHVAIYYGEGRMIHAPKTGKSVEVLTLAGSDYEKELWGARRFR